MRATGFHASPDRACRHQPKAIVAVFLGRPGCCCGAEIYHATAKTDGAAAGAPQRFDSEGLSCEPITENRGRMRSKCEPEKSMACRNIFGLTGPSVCVPCWDENCAWVDGCFASRSGSCGGAFGLSDAGAECISSGLMCVLSHFGSILALLSRQCSAAAAP